MGFQSRPGLEDECSAERGGRRDWDAEGMSCSRKGVTVVGGSDYCTGEGGGDE
jgi:hypothetical protein